MNEVIKKNRISLGYTQNELASMLNVTRQTVSKWELGINEPDIETIKKLADIFNISTEELIIANEGKEKKNLHYILFMLCTATFILNVGILIIYLRFLENIIPAHYNSSYEIDRYGSKYETLFFVFVYILYYAIALLGYYMTKKDIRNKKNSTVIYIVSIIAQVVFGGYVVILNTRYLQSNTLYSVLTSIVGLVSLTLSIFIHPKFNSSQNMIFGFRTTFTLSNDDAWYRLNRVSAITIIILSIIQIIICFIIPFSYYVLLTFLLYIPATIILIIYHNKLKLKLIAKGNESK